MNSLALAVISAIAGYKYSNDYSLMIAAILGSYGVYAIATLIMNAGLLAASALYNLIKGTKL